MIPKLLHYIWLGGEKNELTKKCIESFHTFMSDYELIEWNESNINTKEFLEHSKKFYDECYFQKKYAFCSDVARLYILKEYGGVYVDTDVEFLKTLPDNMLEKAILCSDNINITNGCIFSSEKNGNFISLMVKAFEKQLKKNKNLYGKKWIFNNILTKYFILNGYNFKNKEIQTINNIDIFPSEYFCPFDIRTEKLNITYKTISIHHFNFSWERWMNKTS